MDNGITGPAYVKSHSAIFKIAQVIFSLSAFISMMIQDSSWKGDALIYFNIASLFGMLYSLAMLICNIGNLINIGSPKIDTVMCVIFSIFAFTSASILSTTPFSMIRGLEAFKAAVVLQHFAGFAYLGNAIIKIMN